MNRCFTRFLLPIILFYVGFITLGAIIGAVLNEFVGALIGLGLGVGAGLIANGIVLIIANRTCYRNNDIDYCNTYVK